MAPDDEQFMRDTDALAWNMEQDPGLRSTVVAVAWMNGPPDGEVLAARLERATRLAPKFRRRPVRTPAGLANPQWVDCDFDLSLHLRRITAPEPRTDRTVLEFARLEAMTGFDTSRPLWSFTLVDGLEGDRAALVMKVHHSLTDGAGAMQLAMLVFESTEDPAPVDEVPPPATTPVPSGLGLARGALGHLAGRTVDAARAGLTHAVPLAREAMRHPLRTTLDVVATVSSLGRFVQPMLDTLSPIMTERSLDRYLDLLQVELVDIERAGASVGGTVNDAFVAAVTGGLRRYHEQHGSPVGDLRVTMPIPLHREDDPEGDDRVTLERFAVPAGESNPGERVRVTGWRCRAARYEEALPLSDTVAGLLNLLPPGLVGSMLKHVDLAVSDVSGVTGPVYLAGAPVTGYFTFGPTTGAALNVTLVPYRGVCCVGCTVDTAAVPDADKLMACIRDGFDEVLGLAGEHRRAWSPLDRAG